MRKRKMSFEILAGTHREKGKVYRKGDVVKSNRQLDKIFNNKKFKQLGRIVNPKPEEVEETDMDMVKDPLPEMDLKAVHKGRGKWIVINTETDEQVNEGFLTKDEAKKLESSGSLPEKEEDEELEDED